MCYDEPSEYLFPLVPRYAESDLPDGQTYTQEEAVIYWESLHSGIDSEQQPAAKRERKRPNIASYITEVTRDTLKMMSPSQQQAMTPNLTSHSLRRGAAAYANASPKLAIQWISTRGAWLLESLTKAFAYIGTTTREDQSVDKVLAGYQSPDLPVMTPTIADLQQRLSIAEFGQLLTLRDELFQHVLGSPDPRYNVSIAVVDATFAAMLMHMKSVLESCRAISAPTTRYEYQLHRAIAATNACLGCHISTATCFSWGDHLTARWQTANHAQVSSAATGGDSLLASTLENILKQLAQINARQARLEDTAHKSPVTASETSTFGVSEVPLLSVPAPATASTLAGCVLNWFTNNIWETVKGKREQNKRAEAKAAINIMLVLYQTPCTITKPPPRADAAEYQVWKKTLWDLSLALDRTANARLRSINGRKSSTMASSLRKRWRELRASHPAAYQSLGTQFLSLKAIGAILDLCTPPSHQWSVSELA
ncbi:hypothetical protein PF003_g4644 [Phytophthora fragariae]|nr:hypothetical protein PF003_g4644 [Phytophthora fragariae]